MRIAGALAVVLVLGAAGCVRTAHLYATDVASAPLVLRYHAGRAWIGDRTAPSCQGEYRTSATSPWVNSGAAVLTCQNGRMLECDFEFSGASGQGTGTCHDNEGRRYRVLF